MTVTDIRKIDDKRFCLYIDGEPYASVYASDIRRLKAKVGEEIPGDKLDGFRKDYLYRRAMNKSVGCISYSDKTEQDIRSRLSELYYDDEIIDATVDRLTAYGYIDDYRYACGYIRKYASKKSPRLIAYELSGKHISPDIIDRAMNDTEIPDENTVIKALITRKYSSLDLEENRNRILAGMASRGFSTAKVAKCLREM